MQLHTELQPHLREHFLDLVERLAAEVLRLQQVSLGLLDQLVNVTNVGILQAVRRADAELKLVDRLEEILVPLLLGLFSLGRGLCAF